MTLAKTTQPRRGKELLTATEVKNAKLPAGKSSAMFRDGGGLVLVVRRFQDGVVRKHWRFRYHSPTNERVVAGGKLAGQVVTARREIGLGAADAVTLAAVRAEAQKFRDTLLRREDPLDAERAKDAAERAAKRAAAQAEHAQRTREKHTLRRVTRAYHQAHIEPHKSTKDSQLWINAIEQHVPKVLLDKPIEAIEPRELLDALIAMRAKVPETARRIVQRLGVVWADAKIRQIAPTNLIAEIKPSLAQSRRDIDKTKENHPSLPFARVPAFSALLRTRDDISSRALEFLILTAARTNEVTGARWDEFDLEEGVWTVPAARMKAKESHAVFLPERAVEILKELQSHGSVYAFPNLRDKSKALSNAAMLELVKALHEKQVKLDKVGWLDPQLDRRCSPHGFRASFSTWAYEDAQRARPDLARADVVEACLAHAEANRVKAAYSRSKFNDDRKELLVMWSSFIDSKPAPVSEMAAARQQKTARKAA
jgi:integrase